ncbi:MAG: tetratricopeptide repeat protein [Gammaproteobacteria bacterium]|nr:tetratricopeptide repeat protein [Gammaproteobacteria bacterium]NNJ50836.1 tetratricopeptide repeat protein [Gammaproteobacteria bacterium]
MPRRTLLLKISYTMLFCYLLLFVRAEAAGMASGYSLVLASAPGENLAWQPRENSVFDNRTFFTEQTIIKGKTWERLCLGFFDTRQRAMSILDEVQQIYPGAWVQKTAASNNFTVIQQATTTTVSRANARGPTTNASQSQLSEKQLDSLMQRARSDFKEKKYSSAIRYFTALVDAGDHKYSREALELLGLSRQRKGQKTQAVKVYEKYLAQHPDGESSDRVRQRLAGLMTATRAPRKKMTMKTVEAEDEIITYGSLSQYYRNNRTTLDDIGSITTVSQLISFIDLTTLQKSARFDHRYQFAADHAYDFLDSDDDSEFRFIETYYELSYRKTGSSGRIGRQRLRVGGIIKRFDGLSAGYQITPDMRLNFLGGLPVDIDNKTSINKHKSFYGFTFETGTLQKHWDMNLFYFDQKVDGLQDFRSAGSEVSYRDKRKSMFGMIDYDLFFKELNVLQFNANILFDRGRTAYMNAFLRKSPLLSTSNALVGRQEKSIEELKKVLNIEQIYQLALDRTANSKTVTIGGSQPINEKYQATADITFFQVDGTVASGGAPATQDTGTDYYLSTQLVGNNIFVDRDTGVFGIRYYDTAPSTTISLILNTRFPVTRLWRINPRLQFDSRKLTDGRSQKKFRAVLKTDYRYMNKARFDFEVGYDEIVESGDNQLLGNNNLYFYLGYRWDF